MNRDTKKVLLTGATGYVGGRLRPLLEARGVPLRCLVRDAARLETGETTNTEVFVGDLLDAESLERALEGIETAYYLVHSMGSDGDFEEFDRRAASNFVEAARRAGLRRIVYLGGMGRGEDLSPHLRSRHEVGEILRSSGIPVLELRASIVIGPGSLSFEMIRALVERLPVMITPRWVEVLAQPIAIRDLLAYLLEARDVPFLKSQVVEIGGADRVSYGDLMRAYARRRGLKRWMVKVPVLTPRLSSLWLGLVTPVYARIGRCLIESIRHATDVEEPALANELFSVRPVGMQEALVDALASEEREPIDMATLSVPVPRRPPMAGVRVGNRMVDSRSIRVEAGSRDAFAVVRRIGGETGWYAYDWLWKLRGWIDVLLGGEGMSRGREDASALKQGDALDCWRVETLEEGRLLRLEAEMKLPGRAWLQFEVSGGADSSDIRQTAVFDPCGFMGLAYWYLVCPLHALVFAGMLRSIANAAERKASLS